MPWSPPEMFEDDPQPDVRSDVFSLAATIYTILAGQTQVTVGVPVFDDAHDAAAIATYGQMFPDRRVITVPGREILLGGGNVHCITQQVPSGR